MISDESLKFLGESNRRNLPATKRGELAGFQAELGKTGWSHSPRIPRSRSSSSSERRFITCWHGVGRGGERTGDPPPPASRPGTDLKKLCALVDSGKLKKRDKILERVGRLKKRYPKARGFVQINVTAETAPAGMDVGPSEVQASLGHGWGILVTKQSRWLDGGRILGNLYPVHGRRTGLPSPQERATLAADLASLQRAYGSRSQAGCLSFTNDVIMLRAWHGHLRYQSRCGIQRRQNSRRRFLHRRVLAGDALAQLEAQQVNDLENRLKLNSTNSSKPPSSDPIGLKRKPPTPSEWKETWRATWTSQGLPHLGPAGKDSRDIPL